MLNPVVINKKPAFLWLCFCSCLFFSCKKESDDPFAGVPRTGTRMQLTLDSVFLYASQIYLWRDALPTYNVFKPRDRYGSIVQPLSAFQNEVYDISQMQLNPQTGYAFEYNGTKKTPRYSFITDVPVSISSLAMGGTPAEMPYGADSILESGNKKAAYLLLRGFPLLSDCRQWLDTVFHGFAGQNVEDLVIDLRDNTGGYVATVQYLADLIAVVTMNGKKMYSEAYNPFMQEGKAFLLRQQLYLDEQGYTVNYNGRLATMADVDYSEAGNTYQFSKKGDLNSLKKLYFLVSGTTASAAEMLISILKPWFSVQLIGQRTYGKPVGFFAIKIDTYSLYLASFLIKNADGWYNYFNGMTPDVALNNIDVALDTALHLIDPSTDREMNRVMPSAARTFDIKDPGSKLKNVLIESRWKLKK